MARVILFIRLTGACCTISGGFLTGLSFSESYAGRYRQLEMLQQMIAMIQGEIRYARAELPEVFRHTASRIGAPWNRFLIGMADEMQAMTGQSFDKLWQRQIERTLSDSRLNSADKEMLASLGQELGYLDQTMQLEALAHYREKLQNVIGEYRQNLRKKQKVSVCLGLLGGILLTVMLL